MAEYRLDYAFVAVPADLLDSGLDQGCIAAYVALLSFVRQGQAVRISDHEAAARGGMGDRAFRDARTRLRDAGWVEWRRTGRDNEYTIVTRRILTSATAEIRSAESADQSGNIRRSDRQDPPIAFNGQRNTDTDREATGAKAPPRRTWLSRYIEAHEQETGGVAGTVVGQMAVAFKDLEQAVRGRNPTATAEQVGQTVENHQRRYLRHLKGEGRLEFLSYAKFAQTFGQWAAAKPNGRANRAGRPEDYDASANQSELDRMGR